MTAIPSEAFERIFVPLVGSPGAMETTRQTLASDIHQGGFDDWANPFDRFDISVRGVLSEAVSEAMGDGTYTEEQINKVKSAGSLGLSIIVRATETVDTIYGQLADAPQKKANVARSTGAAVRYIFGFAFSDSNTGHINLAAARYGIDPDRFVAKGARDKLTQIDREREPEPEPEAETLESERGIISPLTFSVLRDRNGQLHISARFKRAKGEGDERCPATDAIITVDSVKRRALATFVHMIGDVAVTEIFPRRFPIVD